MTDSSRLRQTVRYAAASDGARLAWAESGSGPVIVKAANWLTHLEYEWQSPVWKHWLQFFSANSRFVRYDERGCGMSARQLGVLSLEQWAGDLGAIVDAAQPEGAVTLLGISQGAATCLYYALHHPERVEQIDPLRRLRPWRAHAWHARVRRRASRDDRAGAGGVGQRQPHVSPGLHVAFHPGRHAGAARVVQRLVPEDHLRRDGREPARGARAC